MISDFDVFLITGYNRPFGEGMIFHSDRGIQYACKQTVNLLKSLKLEQSMSGKGNCWDNAVAESFFKTFKSELVYGTKLKTREQMRLCVFEYIESCIIIKGDSQHWVT